jgi:hypothetical protein
MKSLIDLALNLTEPRRSGVMQTFQETAAMLQDFLALL